MIKTKDITEFSELLNNAQNILLLQPDKPDGDSLGSILALEEILGDMGKTTTMFTAGRVEPYLSHMPGWDRVGSDWPESFDLAILVDTAAPDQIARLLGDHHPDLHKKPFILIDHHGDYTPIEGVDLHILDPKAAATSEIIYTITKKLKLPLNPRACQRLLSSLFADTLNLTTPSVTAKTVEIYAALIKTGDVDVSALHRAFRESSATDADLLAVKGKLLQSVEFYADGKIALVVIDDEMLKEYRKRTSLSSLVLYEMLWARGVVAAAAISDYKTIIRTSLRSREPISAPVATSFGGGGHPNAAAFSDDKTPLDELKTKLVDRLSDALGKL